MHKVLASALLLCSFSVSADYKNFAWSISDKQGNRVYDTNNVIKAAIEQDRFIPLTYNAEFESATADLFRQVDTLGQFELNAFASPALIKGIQKLVDEFACATYRFEKRQGETSQCNGLVKDKDVKEGKPFQGGQFVHKPLEVTINSLRPNMPNRSYDIYLPSSEEVSLDYTWGAVHELGSFFVHKRDNKDTILTVYIDGYKLDGNGERSNRITKLPEIIFVVIPRASKIGDQSSQNAAASFARSDADIIVPLY